MEYDYDSYPSQLLPQPGDRDLHASGSTPASPILDDPTKFPIKRKGWPADHPTRIAQREAKEAAFAAGLELPRRKYNRKTKREKAAALDDELLGLAEGELGRSSPIPGSDVFDGESDDGPEPEPEPPVEPFDPNIVVKPCGLTRAQVIAKVEANNMVGLTEDDVKAVQDEMWMRKKDLVGGAPIRKDGTVRRKPGPAKGWKKLRGDQGSGRREADHESDAGDTVNGEADADIAALLPDDELSRTKRRKLGHEGEDEDEDDKPDSEDDAALIPRNVKIREPGVGKGRWTRPTKPEKDLLKKAEEIAGQVEAEVWEDDMPPNFEMAAPNSEDPRGVSEMEAKVRLGLVEELQRQAWFAIVRDIPRVRDCLSHGRKRQSDVK